ncbi:MAG: hypothetical protein K2W92_06270 [Alphaproteobacteria bacterium]|nr:hypothetical protein [Alphaproteobacteria bacterium]MBY0292872.1 hypothetical protein [Alphaproteobacteria bacterium]
MSKNKIKLFILILIFSFSFSVPSIAMEVNDDIDTQLFSIAAKLKKDRDKITEENNNLKRNLEESDKTINSLKSRVDRRDKTILDIKKQFRTRTEEFKALEQELIETDDFIEFLLNKKTTPTTISFLSAVYNGKSERKLNDLFRAASNRQEIADIIVGGHTKFKAHTPRSHRKVLELTGLLDSMKITQDDATIQYAKISIPSTNSDELIHKEKSVRKSLKRRESYGQESFDQKYQPSSSSEEEEGDVPKYIPSIKPKSEGIIKDPLTPFED